jgi:hypothetical protein
MGEVTPIPTDAAEENLKWPLPFNVGLDKLDKIVKAFFQARADTRLISAADLKGSTGMNINTIQANAKFLQAIKILKSEPGKDGYSFEDKGKEYAKALSTNDTPKVAPILKELLTDSSLKELIDFAELNKSSEGFDYESLFTQIKAMARVKENPGVPRGVSAPYASGISTLIGLLARAGVIQQDMVAAKKELLRPSIKKAKPVAEIKSPVISQPPGSIKQDFQGQVSDLPFTISVSVEAKDPESIREVVNLLRELKQKSQPNESNE